MCAVFNAMRCCPSCISSVVRDRPEGFDPVAGWSGSPGSVTEDARPYLSTSPLWMVVFIFSVRCSTLD